MTSLAMPDHRFFDGEADLDSEPIGLESAYHNGIDSLLMNPTGITGELLSANARRYMPSSYDFVPVTSGGLNMDILSASSYPDPRPEDDNNASTGRSRTLMYGGIVVGDFDKHDSQMGSGSQEDAPSKKKAKKGRRSSDDTDSKKQRGRPRLDTRDETAADRRRTQIRLAQRAYRLRKETTISALKKRVTELEGTIEEMNKSFLKFNDNAISSGLLRSKPELAQQLKGTTEHFLSLARVAASDSDPDDDAMDDMAPESPTNDTQRWPTSITTKRGGKELRQNSASTRIEQPLGYEVTYEEHEDAESQKDASRDSSMELVRSNEPSWQGLNTYQQFNVQIPDMAATAIPDLFSHATIERPLKPSAPYTYSFQEKSFARRLHRACLERAFRLLTNPSAPQEELSEAFRFTFCFSNKKRMLARFQELLKRTANDSLENWNVPYFHVGGAGTHYPRRDEEGNPTYPPNMHPPAKAFGPSPMVIVETPRDEATVEKMLEAIGFGGEWFDAHDVEEYLKARGILLDGTSSFIEVDPALPTLLPTSTADASSSDTDAADTPLVSPRSPSASNNPPRFINMDSNPERLNDMQMPYSAEEYFPIEPKIMGFGSLPLDESNYEGSPGAFMLENRQIPLTLDVEKLLRQIVVHAVCLGRAPGFRRSDVDNALSQTLQEAAAF